MKFDTNITRKAFNVVGSNVKVIETSAGGSIPIDGSPSKTILFWFTKSRVYIERY